MEKGAALLIIDMQNDYCHENGAIAKRGTDVAMAQKMAGRLQKLLKTAREMGGTIIFVKTVHEACTNSDAWISRLAYREEQLCQKGSWGAEYYAVQPEKDDIEVVKHRYSAFIHTRLESVLRAQKINMLYLAGVSTNICVESTARDGFMYDYKVALVQDCTAAFSKKEHDMATENIANYFGAVTDAPALIKRWRHAKESVSA